MLRRPMTPKVRPQPKFRPRNEMMNIGVSMTFTQDFINKLPL